VDVVGLAGVGGDDAVELLGVTTSPVAAFTRGGPPRKMVPWFRTMTASSLIAGT